MKIFISHSSKDKWAAKRISEDLLDNGYQTFLDEKNIETGQSIDTSIKKHLKDCDDFLVLLSPASIKSEWVLIELGGALALDKRIIPILLYVGANEIPQVISLKLARDINSLHLYYDELKSKNIKGATKRSKIKRTKLKSMFKKGNEVMIVPNRPKNVMRNDSLIDWEPEMDAYLGKTAKILVVNETPSQSYLLEKVSKSGIDYFVFAEEWLVPNK